MFVADDMHIRPPEPGIRMTLGIGAENTGPTLQRTGRGGIEIFQCIHILEIEAQRALGAIQFKAMPVEIARSLARRLETAHCATTEPRQEENAIVNRHTPFATPGT